MKYILSISFALAIFATVLRAGEVPEILKLRSPEGKESWEKINKEEVRQHISAHSALVGQSSRIVRRPYDVLSYEVSMDWMNPLTAESNFGPDRQYWGSNKISMRIDSSNLSSITLNAGSLRIDSVLMGSTKLSSFTQPDDDEFRIKLPAVLAQGQIVDFTVFYTYTGTINDGFHLYPKGMYVGQGRPKRSGATDSIFIDERIAYTMSEPQNARDWMPCNDMPYDKARATMRVRVPDGYTVSSNGLLTATIPLGDSKIFEWRDTTPIATYLMVAHASRFRKFSDWYHRVSNPADSVEIQYYVWPNDYESDVTDGSEFNARHAFRNTPRMMEEFSKRIGEYPFVKYGMTAVLRFDFGGMEHQTMTTVHRDWLRGDDNGIAHELMHQWTGDKVTCATWSDIWLNEGGATWGEALWNEASNSTVRYKQIMSSKRSGYMSQGLGASPIYGVAFANLFNYATTYCKAGWVYHMLRSSLGDSTFFPWFRTYMNEYAFSSVETEDMIASLEKHIPNPPVPFRTFFDQWIYQAGHPVYLVTSKSTSVGSGNYDAKVQVLQTQFQDNVPQVFVMPVQLTLIGQNNDERKVFTVLNDQRAQEYTFTVPFRVDSVIIDENQYILCEKTAFITSVREESESSGATRLYPNPVSEGSSPVFEFAVPQDGDVRIELYSPLGEKIAVMQDGYLGAGNYSLLCPVTGLASGAYLVRSIINGNSQAYPLKIVR